MSHMWISNADSIVADRDGIWPHVQQLFFKFRDSLNAKIFFCGTQVLSLDDSQCVLA